MVIPVNEPLFSGNELKYVSDCINSGWISSAGNYLGEFEASWAKYCDRKHGIGTTSGTTALQVAMLALELPPGSEVIIPTFTIVSCALAVLYAGLVPVLVDCDPETLNIDVTKIEQKITSKTKAIMPVHIYGHSVDMDPILELAKKYDLKIIEDAAEAHGAEYKGKKCGSFGDISCFSFYANKIITTGEGGMLLTNDDVLSDRIKNIINLYLNVGTKRFFHDGLGFNYRLTNVQAAIGLAQVENIDNILKIKRSIGTEYTKELSEVGGIKPLVVKDWASPVYWMYGILIDETIPLDANQFSNLLQNYGVQTRPFFLGMHEQPIFKKLNIFKDEYFPVSTMASKKGLYLPSGLTLTGLQIKEVCIAVKEIMNGFIK